MEVRMQQRNTGSPKRLRAGAGAVAILLAIAAGKAAAETFPLYEDVDLVGEFRTETAAYKDTLLDIARRNGLGYHEIKAVNESVDTWLPGEGEQVVLPKRHILPSGNREGLVVNIPEMRLYYFVPARADEPRKVMTYPLGIGREGWNTPYITTKITQKMEQPTWHPPESIRKEYAKDGKILPRVVPPGPENPLGDFAMRLGLPSYLIHGTNKPWGVGMRVSSGCIRLYPEHIEELFQQVSVGTSVRIVNEPFKIGMHHDILYFEAHSYLVEDAEQFTDSFNIVVGLILEQVGDENFYIDWELVREVMDDTSGVPVAVGMRLPLFERVAAAEQ